MARLQTILLDALTAAGASAPFFPTGQKQTVQAWVTAGIATAIVEGTNDPIAWTDPDSAQWSELDSNALTFGATADAVTVIDAPYLALRARGGSFTAGVLSASICDFTE